MTTVKRRDFLNAAAMAAGGAALVAGSPVRAATQAAAKSGLQKAPGSPKAGWPVRDAKVEILFKAPGNSANGMQCVPEGIWTVDPAGSRTDTPGKCKVYLSSYEGKMLRELSPESTGPSGIGSDGKTLYIGSTYSREIVRVDATTGATLENHMTPGAGVIYRMTTDVPQRPDTYGASVRAAAAPAGTPAAGGGGRGGRGGRGRGAGGAPGAGGPLTFPGPPGPGTGAHGVQIINGKLWVAVPPGRMVYRIDPTSWMVEHMFPSVGFRPHGIGWEGSGNYLWESDTNMGAFFKRDMTTGEVVQEIRVPDGSPFPHGMSVINGYIYWVDDIGGGNAPICRTKI